MAIQTTTNGRTGNTAIDQTTLQRILDSIQGYGSKIGSQKDLDFYGKAADVLLALQPQKQEYNGTYGGTTQALDKGYDDIANAAKYIPGAGPVISDAMKGTELVGKGLDAIGGGTSGMTRTDAVLGSTLGEMTPLGLVNGFFGKKSKSLDLNEKSNNTMSTIGSSYGGAVNDWNNAFQKSRKKYGLFSSGARHKANNLINNANGNMNTMNGISDTAQTQQLLENTMGDIDAENYRMNLLGGYNKRIQIGKNGIRLTLDRIKDKALAMQNSSFIKDEDTEDICDVPDDYDPDMFKPGYSNVLDKDNPRMFQAGGEMNLIPEGALHARKNDMKVDNITKKGIPVVDENGKQQAEIEKNEIIFKKDVSHQLETLAKDGSDDAAIKAGKILAHEIMENTDDRTGLIPAARNGMKLQQGGTVRETKYGQPAKDMKPTGSIADNRMANEKDVLTKLLMQKKL